MRNIPALSEEDMEKLAASRVVVVGCGGLGGNIIEHLSRIGIGKITVADGDVFDESNLNRQLLCTAENIGESKADAAAKRIRAIDPSIEVKAVGEFLTQENAPAILADADIVIDALDNIKSRLVLEDAAADAGTILIHGAAGGWNFQAMTVPPGSGLLRSIYEDMPAPEDKSVLSFAPSACAALQVSLAVSILCGKQPVCEGRLITGSLCDMRFDTIDLNSEADQTRN